jgi:hypothetical protein
MEGCFRGTERPLTPIGRRFALSDMPGVGVSCGEDGVFVGGVPLLERISSFNPNGRCRWQLRPISALNLDLSARYGLPIEFDQKIDALRAVGQALDRGDLVHAQIGTLHLEIPDPPALAKFAQTFDDVFDFARQLRRSRMLKADWDPTSIRAGRQVVQTGSVKNSLRQARHSTNLLPASKMRIKAPSPNRMRRSYRRKLRFRLHLNFRAEYHSRQKSCRHRLSRISVPAICRQIHIPTDQNVSRSGLKRRTTV